MVNEYRPDYAVPPGEILAEEMEAKQLSQSDLADRTGLSRKTINEIVNGKAPITPETALKFEPIFQQPARYWLNLERDYQETLARLQEQAALEQHVTWLDTQPLKEMIGWGWVEKKSNRVEQLRDLLTFYSISNPNQWEKVWSNLAVAYRKANIAETSPIAISAWLRQGQHEAAKISCKTYNKDNFAESFSEIRGLTREADPKIFVQKLIDVCATNGVAVVFLPELKKTGICGATYWQGDTPVIQLSLRYKSDDHLWFTFFHEAGHILLHGKKELFLEGDRHENNKEQEANDFAARSLIPKDRYGKLLSVSRFSESVIVSFAENLGIAPGIVVGRLQHDQMVPYTHFNALKNRFVWTQN